MRPEAEAATATRVPVLPTPDELRQAALDASAFSVALFEAVHEARDRVVDFRRVHLPEDLLPGDLLPGDLLPGDLLPEDRLQHDRLNGRVPRRDQGVGDQLGGIEGLRAEVRDQVLDSWRRVLATGVPDERVVWVPALDGAPAGSWGLLAFTVGGALGVAGRPQPLPAAAPGPDPSLAQSLLAAGVSSWEWDPDADVLSSISSPPGMLGTASRDGGSGLQDFLDRVHPGDRAIVERAFRDSLETHTPFRTQFRLLRPGSAEVDPHAVPESGQAGRSRVLAGKAPTPVDADDGSLILRMLGNASSDGGHRRVAGVLEDVTDVTRARQALTQNQRLASLGQLAAGIAHDFNNVLTVVTMRADMLRAAARDNSSPAQSEEDATAILEAASRASALTRQLMLFAGHQGGRPAEIEIGEVVTALRPLVEAMREDVFATRYEIDVCPPVSTDHVQVEQIVINLALNARDALREVPQPADRPLVLTIRVRALAGDSPELVPLLRAPAIGGHGVPDPAGPTAATRAPAGDEPRAVSWVVLEVADTGVGMSPDTRARALDPFFTTKPVGAGTGLGLSVVHGLVEQIGGRLTVESDQGRGTTVRVALPGSRPVATPTRSSPVERPAGTPTRLVVVDDDDAVRTVTARSLKMNGFEVVQASSAKQALEALAREPDIAALVSDIVMPGMSGTDLAARVLAEYPHVPVLLVTGYTPPTDVIGNPRLSLVTKPLTGTRLAQSLRELLDRVARDSPEGDS